MASCKSDAPLRTVEYTDAWVGLRARSREANHQPLPHLSEGSRWRTRLPTAALRVTPRWAEM
jgi:hypothetical protein